MNYRQGVILTVKKVYEKKEVPTWNWEKCEPELKEEDVFIKNVLRLTFAIEKKNAINELINEYNSLMSEARIKDAEACKIKTLNDILYVFEKDFIEIDETSNPELDLPLFLAIKTDSCGWRFGDYYSIKQKVKANFIPEHLFILGKESNFDFIDFSKRRTLAVKRETHIKMYEALIKSNWFGLVDIDYKNKILAKKNTYVNIYN